MDKELLQKLAKVLESKQLLEENNIFSKVDQDLEIIWDDVRTKLLVIVEKLGNATSVKEQPIKDLNTALDTLFLLESEQMPEELVGQNALKSFLESLNKYAYECRKSINVRPEGKII